MIETVSLASCGWLVEVRADLGKAFRGKSSKELCWDHVRVVEMETKMDLWDFFKELS